MPKENQRLLLAIDNKIREINRRTLNETITELSLADLHPVIEMVAKSRATYLHALIELASKTSDTGPSDDDMRHLSSLRLHYEELIKAMQALEAAIERDYLDVGKP